MPMPMPHESALVTGATRGVGLATARALARSGFAVIIACRDNSRGAEVAAEIRASGGAADVVELDLRSMGSVRRAAAEVQRMGVTLKVVVCNAAINDFTAKLLPTLTEDGLPTMYAARIACHPIPYPHRGHRR